MSSHLTAESFWDVAIIRVGQVVGSWGAYEILCTIHPSASLPMSLFSHSVVSDSWDPMDYSLPSHFLLQGSFPTQEWNPHLLYWQMDSCRRATREANLLLYPGLKSNLGRGAVHLPSRAGAGRATCATGFGSISWWENNPEKEHIQCLLSLWHHMEILLPSNTSLIIKQKADTGFRCILNPELLP